MIKFKCNQGNNYFGDTTDRVMVEWQLNLKVGCVYM